MTSSRRQRKDKWANRFAIIGISVVVGFLAIAVNVRGSSLKQQDRDYEMKQESLEAAIADEERRAEELEEYKVYVKTKQYIEEVAREKLGLVKPDEIIIKPEE